MQITTEKVETVAALLRYDGFQHDGDVDTNRRAEFSVTNRLTNLGLSEADAEQIVTHTAQWIAGER